MKNIFRPFEGVGDISFGISRDELRKIVKGTFEEIMRNQYAENSSDYYHELGFFIEYSKDNICNAVEFSNSCRLLYPEEDLFELNYTTLRNIYDALSSNIEVEENIGVTYYDLGFAATFEHETDKIQSVLVFSRDYW